MPELLRIQHVVSAEADRRWAEFEPHVNRAMAHCHVIIDLRSLIRDAHMGLLEAVDKDGVVQGCALLQFVTVELGGETVLRVIAMAGINYPSVEAFWPSLCALARNNGASAIETFGRPGFIRWAKGLGLRPIYTILRAEV